MPDGEAVVYLGGELDTSNAEAAFAYVSDVIDRCLGPVVVDLSGLDSCDCDGLRALVRMGRYAEHSGAAFQLAAPRESLVEIVENTGLYPRFPVF
jgi:anti-anti-sigma factor